MENIWNIYGMAALIIILYSVVGKPKGNKLRNLWISYIVVGFLLGVGLDVFKTKKNKENNE
jgi:FtsH-binding integral membrane protein